MIHENPQFIFDQCKQYFKIKQGLKKIVKCAAKAADFNKKNCLKTCVDGFAVHNK